MSKQPDITPELQIEINRAKWIQALRENGHRQCIGRLRQGRFVCGIGLACEIFNVPNYPALRLLLGFPIAIRAARDNDDGWTFAQIADAAEQGRYW